MLFALSLLEEYNYPMAIYLLEKDKYEVLQAFRKDPTDLLNHTSVIYKCRQAEAHLIRIVHYLFIFACRSEDSHLFQLGYQCRTIYNTNLFSSIVDICYRTSTCDARCQVPGLIYSFLLRTKSFLPSLDLSKDITPEYTLRSHHSSYVSEVL